MTVIDLEAAREQRTPHASGEAHCLQCGHEWVATAPVGEFWLKCPQCDCEKGCFYGPHYPNDGIVWQCSCGNQLWLLTSDGPICPNCGEYSESHA